MLKLLFNFLKKTDVAALILDSNHNLSLSFSQGVPQDNNGNNKGKEEDNPYKGMSQEERDRRVREWDIDREDYGWGDPYEDLYDEDDDYFGEEEEDEYWEWPEDERPKEPPRLKYAPRLSLSERIEMYLKTNKGKTLLPLEEARDFWDKIRRRDVLHPKKWQRMEAHIEEYADQWKRLRAESEEAQRRKQWPAEYESLDLINSTLEQVKGEKLSLELSIKKQHESVLEKLQQRKEILRQAYSRTSSVIDEIDDKIRKQNATLEELLEQKRQRELRRKQNAELESIGREITETISLRRLNDRPGISRKQKIALKLLDKQIIELEKRKAALEASLQEKKDSPKT